MVAIGISIYLIVNVVIGLYYAKKVHTTDDFLIAGKKLPMHLATGALFATWFGAETILGASAEMADKGILGVIEDPFGAALCLALIGLFFAKPLYRMNLHTFADFYKNKFGNSTENLASFLIILSLIPWVSGQFVALGIMLQTLLGINLQLGIIIGACIVIMYTFTGGLVSIVMLDFFQNIMIILGLCVVLAFIGSNISWSEWSNTLPKGYFRAYPQAQTTDWLNYFAAWITLGLGSIPGQDVFQRVMSSKSEKTAIHSAYLASFLYLFIGIIPLIIATHIRVKHPEILTSDNQLMIPTFIQQNMPEWVQLMFFGSLASAIMSTASGALLAPSAILSENVLQKYFPTHSEKTHLRMTRMTVLLVGIICIILSLQDSNVYSLVSESSSIGLVSLLVPFIAGIWSKKIHASQAIGSMLLGLTCWILAKILETDVNPGLYGLLASILGWYLPKFLYTNF